MEDHRLLILGCAALALLFGLVLAKCIMRLPTGNAKMQEIAAAIQEGAKAYLRTQYLAIIAVGIIVMLALWAFLGWYVGLGFVIGGVCSGLSGFIGMHISVRANVRTTQAATESLEKALGVSFRSGAVTGMLVVGLGLLGVAGYYFGLQHYTDLGARELLEALVGLGFGASLISIFARLGGGIFTKGADVGADLVGK